MRFFFYSAYIIRDGIARRRSRAILVREFLVIRPGGNAFNNEPNRRGIRDMTFQMSLFTASRFASLTAGSILCARNSNISR